MAPTASAAMPMLRPMADANDVGGPAPARERGTVHGERGLGSGGRAVGVDADDHAVARPERELGAIGLLVDGALIEACLDRGRRSADALHLGQELPGAGFEVVSQRLDE